MKHSINPLPNKTKNNQELADKKKTKLVWFGFADFILFSTDTVKDVL